MTCCGAALASSSTKSTGVPEHRLTGVRVLVTRPAHQADQLVRLIEAAGGEALRLPTIEISPPLDPAALNAVLEHLHEFNLAIFLSPNAVRLGLPLLRAHRMPAGLRLAAVGLGTQEALRAEGFDQVLAPSERFDSEALLELLPAGAVAGQNILLVRGAGGRELLSEQLRARGARLSHAECYRRVPPRQPDAAVLARLQRGEIDIISITSVEGLHNLYELAGTHGRTQLLATAVLVVSERQAQTCRQLGFQALAPIAARASDAAIVEALRVWQATRNSL